MEAWSEFCKEDGCLGIETDRQTSDRKFGQEIVTGQDFPDNPDKNETRTVASKVEVSFSLWNLYELAMMNY